MKKSIFTEEQITFACPTIYQHPTGSSQAHRDFLLIID